MFICEKGYGSPLEIIRSLCDVESRAFEHLKRAAEFSKLAMGANGINTDLIKKVITTSKNVIYFREIHVSVPPIDDGILNF